jgi:hypothetical protein
MAERKVKFGSMASCVVKYVIIVLFPSECKFKFVTSVQSYPHKYCEWKDGEKAIFFSKKYAEDICFGLNVNGTSCFVMEVPDFFNEEDFFNPEKEKEDEKSD